jgi:hypothetical protein
MEARHMLWPWNSPAESDRRAAARDARFVQIAREAHERARCDLGAQRLKPRDWESGHVFAPDIRQRRVRRIGELSGRGGRA